jgi:hypothetical protein
VAGMGEVKGVEVTKPKGREQFKPIYAQTDYSRTLAVIDRIEMTVIELQNLQRNNTKQTKTLSQSIGMLDNSILELHLEVIKLNSTIAEANKKNDKLQNKLFWLTIAGTVFALISLVEAGDIILKRVFGV